MKRAAAVVFAASLALVLQGCTATDVAMPTAPVDLGDADTYAQALFAGSNAERVAAGLPALEWSDCLAEAALPRAEASLGTEPLTHLPLPSPCTPGVTAGENLTRYWGPADEVVTKWMDSEAHRNNILNPAFMTSGITCLPYAYDDPSAIAKPGELVAGMVCSQLFEGS